MSLGVVGHGAWWSTWDLRRVHVTSCRHRLLQNTKSNISSENNSNKKLKYGEIDIAKVDSFFEEDLGTAT